MVKQCSLALIIVMSMALSSTAYGFSSKPSEDDAKPPTAQESEGSEGIQNKLSVKEEAPVAVSTVSDADLLETLLTYSISDQMFLDHVPKRYQDDIRVSDPMNDLVNMESKITIKGQNRWHTPTFVGNKQIRLRGDGQFFYEHTLTQPGKQHVFITFTTPDNRFFTIKKRVVKLIAPPDIDEFEDFKKLYTYFYNTPYLYNPDQEKTLKGPFTRAELAYFLAMITKSDLSGEKQSYFKDVSQDHWAQNHINVAIKQQWMSEFPDGNFKPDDGVTKMEFIVTMIRVLQYPISSEDFVLPFRDVDATRWTAKYIHTALVNGLIQPETFLNPDDPLSLSKFMLMAQYVSLFQTEMKTMIDFTQGFDLNPAEHAGMLSPVATYLATQEEKFKTLKKMTLESPQQGDIILEPIVTVKGKIFPPKPFHINGETVSPDHFGEFEMDIAVEDGKNSIKIHVFGQDQILNVYRLSSYEDLKGHWFEDAAARLKYLEITENAADFNPNTLITRAEFAYVLSHAFQFDLVESGDASRPTDVSERHPSTLSIMALIQKNILSAPQGQFFPHRNITRAEAITALIRAVELAEDPARAKDFPYWDVPTSHWSRPFVEIALAHGILSPSKQFFPKKSISKSQLYALISRTPHIKQRLTQLFAGD